MSAQQNQIDYSQFIAENFGANATYVETLLDRFRSDPSLVDESWRAYFAEMLGQQTPASVPASSDATASASSGNGAATATEPRASDSNSATLTTAAATITQPAASATQTAPAPAATPAQTAPAPATATAVSQPGAETAPIRGAALKIVENMETSLTVPTATSNRQVPVKLLEENRGIINKHLKEHGGGKTSFTHLIAYALLRALEKYPQLNDGFTLSEGKPARVRRAAVNLGVAIDVQKKDGTRSLL
ncbi:MAG TPA: 2-oxo acid dehydrogenase subunit E2, partial [Pyrinomonadaceae bacterium]|nr:2-oxo acid dehydrogenase subunit E2 [Pyrinomonadaceae bacterium]